MPSGKLVALSVVRGRMRVAAAKMRVMAHVRPPIPADASKVYGALERLIAELLFRGSENIEGDAEALLAELAAAEYRDCATQNVCYYELGRVLATASIIGPNTRALERVLWPHGGEGLEALTSEVMALLERSSTVASARMREMIASSGAPWSGVVAPRPRRDRATKRPRDPERHGFYRELVRDEVFAGRSTTRAAFRAAKLALINRPTSVASVETELKLLRAGKKKAQARVQDPSRLAPIPRDFHQTLFARRLAPYLRNPSIAALLENQADEKARYVVERTRRRRSARPVKSLPPSS